MLAPPQGRRVRRSLQPCRQWYKSAVRGFPIPTALRRLPRPRSFCCATVQSPALAQRAAEVDLALVLAVDASGSISDDRWDLERQGYAQAFRDPALIKAIQSGAAGAIAVTLVEWSGRFQQSQVIGWTLVNDAASAERFAAKLADMPHLFRSWTAIGAGLAYSAELFRQLPYVAQRYVIDISGDGPDSTSEVIIQGSPADLAQLVRTRDQLVGEGLVINGLPIFGDPRIRAIDLYYANSVIGGPGSFYVVAEDFTTFAAAVKRKLLLEVAGTTPGVQPAVVRRIDAAGLVARGQCRIWLRKARVRSCFGMGEELAAGGPTSMIWPPSMKTMRSATWRAKPISWVTTTMVMPSSARSTMTSSTSLIISGSRAEVGSSNSMILRVHAQRPGDRHPLLLAAGELAGIFAAPARECAPVRGSAWRPPRRRAWACCAPRSAPACNSPGSSGAGTG